MHFIEARGRDLGGAEKHNTPSQGEDLQIRILTNSSSSISGRKGKDVQKALGKALITFADQFQPHQEMEEESEGIYRGRLHRRAGFSTNCPPRCFPCIRARRELSVKAFIEGANTRESWYLYNLTNLKIPSQVGVGEERKNTFLEVSSRPVGEVTHESNTYTQGKKAIINKKRA